MLSRVVQTLIYASLFVLLIGSAVFFIFSLVTGAHLWVFYNRTYFLLLLAYTWFNFSLLFWGDLKEKKFPRYGNERISVIIPCYNEDLALFKRSLMSVVEAHGNKEIIVIDDGSTNEIHDFLEEYQSFNSNNDTIDLRPNIRVYAFPENRGKRHALHHAVTEMIRESDFVVTIDSDTVLDPYALIRVVEPLLVPGVGASTGDVRLLNEKENWLTKMIGTYYWIGLNIYKKAQSTLGMVICCSGCLAAYRSDAIREIIDAFVNQEFFGEKCTHSEDRHLTNLILKNNYKVIYTPEAISYTQTPSTIRGFLKQQQRWKRGYIRESIYTLTYAWKTRPLLFFQLLLWDLTIPFFSFGLMLVLIFTLFTNPSFFLTTMVPSWIMFMLVRYIHVLFYAREKILGLFVYMFFYDALLYWQFIYALFTVKNKSWITR